jgi:hypothetical protein
MYQPNAGLLVVQTIKYLHFSDEKIKIKAAFSVNLVIFVLFYNENFVLSNLVIN